MWDYPDTEDAIMPTVQVRKFRDIGPVIKAVRESHAVRQEDLAERLAFSRDYLIDLEKGKGSLYITRLFRTLNELGITVTLTYEAQDGKASNVDT
ncbi:helix-turn-helix domain-containing protein [Cryobacterium aureum]|uniref:helix-turn-helix domain-containing protein n=1 Tax=Cryobacterium aureum TaxID=995037 RepID=UPI000CF37D81|nr:helix-turn-helix domain-containing protein [Cryobacterium aureum]